MKMTTPRGRNSLPPPSRDKIEDPGRATYLLSPLRCSGRPGSLVTRDDWSTGSARLLSGGRRRWYALAGRARRRALGISLPSIRAEWWMERGTERSNGVGRVPLILETETTKATALSPSSPPGRTDLSTWHHRGCDGRSRSGRSGTLDSARAPLSIWELINSTCEPESKFLEVTREKRPRKAAPLHDHVCIFAAVIFSSDIWKSQNYFMRDDIGNNHRNIVNLVLLPRLGDEEVHKMRLVHTYKRERGHGVVRHKPLLAGVKIP